MLLKPLLPSEEIFTFDMDLRVHKSHLYENIVFRNEFVTKPTFKAWFTSKGRLEEICCEVGRLFHQSGQDA